MEIDSCMSPLARLYIMMLKFPHDAFAPLLNYPFLFQTLPHHSWDVRPGNISLNNCTDFWHPCLRFWSRAVEIDLNSQNCAIQYVRLCLSDIIVSCDIRLEFLLPYRSFFLVKAAFYAWAPPVTNYKYISSVAPYNKSTQSLMYSIYD